MLTALRQQVQESLNSVPVRRKPALRRTDVPDALLATDLPLAADAEAVASFSALMTAQGWRVIQRENWLLLDTDVSAPETIIPKTLRGESGCCISLLLRHPSGDAPAGTIRALVKAAEAGKQPFERLCRQLHAELAAALRRHEPLPGGLLPYLCRAYNDLYS